MKLGCHSPFVNFLMVLCIGNIRLSNQMECIVSKILLNVEVFMLYTHNYESLQSLTLKGRGCCRNIIFVCSVGVFSISSDNADVTNWIVGVMKSYIVGAPLHVSHTTNSSIVESTAF